MKKQKLKTALCGVTAACIFQHELMHPCIKREISNCADLYFICSVG